MSADAGTPTAEAVIKATSYLSALVPIIEEIVAPSAAVVDREGTYPREALDALGQAGLLGLISAPEVGGMGQAHEAAALLVEELARHCASTAMVVIMHYSATAVIEAHGPEEVRRRIAAGDYVASVAFSEAGSRSHFWAPTSTATKAGDGRVRLDAEKSWVTSAGQADGYVWSSLPLAAEGASSIWLVPADAPGLKVGAPFNGLGLRGNHSSPMSAALTTIVIRPSAVKLLEASAGSVARVVSAAFGATTWNTGVEPGFALLPGPAMRTV